MGIFSRFKDAVKSKLAFDSNIALGVLKGAASTITTVGELGDAALANTVGRIGGKNSPLAKPVGIGSTEAVLSNAGIKDAMTPTNTAQKGGFAAEQIGEFFIPSGLAAKGAKAVEIAAGASKFAKPAAAVARAVGEGISSGAVSLAQTGDAKEAGVSAAMGSGLSALAPALTKVSSYLNEKIAPRIINSLIKPVSKEFEFGRNAGAGVVREGIKANTKGQLLDALVAKEREIGKMISEKLTGAVDKVVDLSPAVSKIDDAIKKANKSGEGALAARLKDIKSGITSVFDEISGAVKGERSLVMTPEEARILKTEIGDATRWTGQAFDNDVNQARVAVYRAINDIIDAAVPGVKKLNARYSDILSASRALQRTIDITERANLVGLIPAGLGTAIGVGQSVASGDSAPEAFLKGIAGAALGKFAGSTGAKTRIAVPIVKSLGNTASGLVSESGNAARVLSGVAAKAATAGDSGEPSEAITVDAIKSSFPSKYHDFIDAAAGRGYTPEQIMSILKEKASQ